MISYEQFHEIHFCYDKLSMSKEQIARSLNLSPTTVRDWLERDSYGKPKPRQRKSKLDTFHDRIKELLVQCPDYSGSQILQIISSEGYRGSSTILNDYLRSVRPKARKAYLSLNFPAGESAQVDWGVAGYIDIDGRKRKVSYFVIVLCYSRMMYVQFTLGEAQEFWLECHKNAFEYFGGVPLKVMVDNCKTAVISHRAGEAVQFNNDYVDFARHYGFRIIACNVRQPQEKGRVENGVGYVRKNFLVGRNLKPFELLNLEAKNWMDNIANKRIHGTTGKSPMDLFKDETLQKLPLEVYRCSVKKPLKVDKLFRIRHEANTYSVPAEYAFESAIAEVFTDKLIIWSKERIIAEHSRYFGSKKDIENPLHSSRLIETRKRASEQKLVTWLLRLSPRAEKFYAELEKRSLNKINELKKIAALATTYSEQEIALALEDALHFQACNADYIRNIIDQKRQALPESGPLHISHKTDQLHMHLSPPDLNIYEAK